MKNIKNQNYAILLENLEVDSSIEIPAGSRIDSITYNNPGASTGNLTLGAKVPGVAEVQTLSVTGAPSSDGDVTIVLDGATGVAIALLATDGDAGAAAKIGAGTYPGWDVEVSGTDVIFTSETVGARAGAFTFTDTDTTGATASFAQTVAGTNPTTDESVVAEVAVDAITIQDLTLVKNCFAADTLVSVGKDATVSGTLTFRISPIL